MRTSKRLFGIGLVVALLAPGSWQVAGAAGSDDLAARRRGLAAAGRRSLEPAGRDPVARLAALQGRMPHATAAAPTPSPSPTTRSPSARSQTAGRLSRASLPWTTGRVVVRYDSFIGDCSRATSPAISSGWSRSIGYYSNWYYPWCSVSSLSDAVATFHRIRLPAAVKYGPVRVGAYGREAVRGYHDYAGLFYDKPTARPTAGGCCSAPLPGPTTCPPARPGCWAAVARSTGA
jgi:hypothetical protein